MLLEKIALGITLAAPIGPVSLEMIQRGLKNGFLSAFVVRLGGAIGNILCLIIATFGLSFLIQSPLAMNGCSLVGAIVLMYLGIKAIIKTTHFKLNLNEETKAYTHINGLATGFVVSIANPIGIMFWISIFAASFNPNDYGSHWASLSQNTAIILGVLLWGILLSALLQLGKMFFSERAVKYISFVAGAMLIYFGMKYGFRAVSAILS